MMKQTNYNLENYYTTINKNKVYVDYTNSRVKILNCNNISIETIINIINFSLDQSLGKIICNCDHKYFKVFIEAGFQLEGIIDGYFKGVDGICMSYFLDENRQIIKDSSIKNSLLKQSLKLNSSYIYTPNSKYYIRTATETDIKEMIELFSNVFSTYPSSIYDENYLKETMNEKVLYKVAIDNEKIISIASADMNIENLNAEITDCATYPNYRGKGILSDLIYSLELELKKRRFMTLYSLCRAINPGINFVLKKHNYSFRGRLLNNCNICGGFEDMNIWVKDISND